MMRKLYIPLSLAVAATLAACGGHMSTAPASKVTHTYYAPAPAVTYGAGLMRPGTVAVIPAGGVVIQSTVALRSGYGRVESKMDVMDTAGMRTSMQRLSLKMDDGSWQVVDSSGPNLAIGDRVEITGNGYIRYPV